MFGAQPQNPNNIFWPCAFQTPPSQVSKKHFCWPVDHRGMGVWGATPEPKRYSLVLCSSNTTTKRYPKTLLLVNRVPRYWCRGPHPRTQTIFFGMVQFKHHHPSYTKTPLLANRVQRHWWLERHPRTQTTSFGIVHYKQPHPRYPKTPLLVCRVQRYERFGHHPRTQAIFC